MKTPSFNVTHEGQSFDLPDGYQIIVSTAPHEHMGAPWEEHEGHGIVSEWVYREKRAGEWILATDGRAHRFYDFAETLKIARKDWGLGDDDKAKLAAKLGRTPTAREIAVESVRHDFEFLRGWCADEWQWIGVIATLRSPKDENGDRRTIDTESIWGVESLGDYWKELAAENAESIAIRHAAQSIANADAESLHLAESIV